MASFLRKLVDMYESHFQFNVRPFPSAPRSEFYFPAAPIENAHHKLARLIERAEGPGVLIGGPGTGKSLVCQMLAERFRETFHVVMLNSAQLNTRRALLQHILFGLGLPYRGMDEGELRLSLIEFLGEESAAKEGVLLLVDEAHTLPLRLFEDIRMFTNLARDGQSRVRVVMAGGPQLEERFADPELESFNQRLAARCYLQPLNYDETCAYVYSQIAKAGTPPNQILQDDAWQAIYHASDGIPRLINQVCDHALLLACAGGRRTVDGHAVEEAWADLQQLPTPWQPSDKEAPLQAGVVEFGELGSEDAEDRDCAEIEIADQAESESTQNENSEPSTPEFESSFDLDERLDQVQRQLDEIEDQDRCPPAATSQDVDEVAPDLSAGRRSVAATSANPFDERFDQEEVVVDRYAALQAAHPGDTPMTLKQREITSAMQTIFENVSQPETSPSIAAETPFAAADNTDEMPAICQPEDRAQNSAASEPTELPVRLEPIEDDVPNDLQEQVLQTPTELGLSPYEDATDPAAEAPLDCFDENEQETCIPLDAEQPQEKSNRVEVIRTPPPDDNDMIIVVDNQHGMTPLRSSGGISHRQEYRQLFSRLRQS